MDPLIEKILDSKVNTTNWARARRGIASGAIVGTMVVGAIALTTGAVFTDTERVDNSAFTTGTVDIATSPTQEIVQSANLAPGDTVTNIVEVGNSGSLEYRYAVTDLASNLDGKDLHTQLQMAIYHVTSAAQCTKAGTDIMTPLGSKAGVSLTEEKLFGDNTQGGQTGDRVLPSGGSELLCVRVDLPLSTPNAFQASTSDLSFTFYAEQTANNA